MKNIGKISRKINRGEKLKTIMLKNAIFCLTNSYRIIEKCSISFKFKKGEKLALLVSAYASLRVTLCNRRNTLSILRIALTVSAGASLRVTSCNFEPDAGTFVASVQAGRRNR